jgi:CheY-like chemotaxis protein
MLEPIGIAIDFAEDGAEVLERFQADPERYALIFMDLQMPKMNGFEATEHIRALNHPRAGTIPIIAMTANVFKEDIDRCFAAGMNGHLGKPLSLNSLHTTLKAYLLNLPG